MPSERWWRPSVPAREGTAALLRDLARRGFAGAPRHLNVDEQGRDILSIVPGEPVPALRGDDQLVQVATLLREFHDASVDFIPRAGSTWRVPPPAPLAPHGRIILLAVPPCTLLE